MSIAISSWGNIHVIGDSHGYEFFPIVPLFYIHYLGPATMHRMGRDPFNMKNLKDFAIRENDVVIWAFGEIDCRCHILKQHEQNQREVSEVIQTLAEKYVQTILSVRSQYQNLTCILYSVTPPTEIANNPQFPRYGSLQEIVQVTKELNEVLKNLCARESLLFLDVYDDYADENGILRWDLSDGNVHISSAHNRIIAKKLLKFLSASNRRFLWMERWDAP